MPSSLPSLSTSRPKHRCKRLKTCASIDQSTSTPSKPQIGALPTSFRRLVATSSGPSFSSVARIEEYPMLSPSEGQVLIKVLYAGINGGCETFRARGEYAFSANKTATSFALGAEGAGIIVGLGPNLVQNFTIGQHVTFIGGAFAEYVTANAALCWPVLESNGQTVALTISGTVANAALRYVANIKPHETVLVTAAGGATGSFAAQLAKRAGCRVVATCGSVEKARKLQALSLDRVINYHEEDVEEVICREFGQHSIDVAYEGVGGSLQQVAWRQLRRPGGRLLCIGYISEYPHTRVGNENNNETNQLHTSAIDVLPPSDELFWGGKQVTTEDGRTAYGKVWPSERSETLQAKQELFDMYTRGEIEAWVDNERFIGLESCVDAVEYMLSGVAVGKVVVEVSRA